MLMSLEVVHTDRTTDSPETIFKSKLGMESSGDICPLDGMFFEEGISSLEKENRMMLHFGHCAGLNAASPGDMQKVEKWVKWAVKEGFLLPALCRPRL
jgi:hypothetical protein